MVLSILFSFIVSIADYISDEIIPNLVEKKTDLISFTAGISVTYIFLELLANLYDGIAYLDRYIFLFLLAGFIIFHLAEKHIYQHVQNHKKTDLTRIHLAGLFVYHFIIGILLVAFTERSIIEGFLLLVPVSLHTALSNLGSHEIEDYVKKVYFSLASVYGAVIAFVFRFPETVIAALTSFIAGVLIYIVVRETIPKDKEGNAKMFVMGAVLYALLIIVTWLIKI